jgi:RNA polymerase sigma-70 factor, ECF subfamily
MVDRARPALADTAGIAELRAVVRAMHDALASAVEPAYALAQTSTNDPLVRSRPGFDRSEQILLAVHSETAKARTGGAHVAHPRDLHDQIEDAETRRIVALVELAKGGDAEAFGQLYDHYLSTIYRYVYYRVGTHVLAEDLTSETFLRALRALNSFHWQGRDFGAWLVTIARNLVTDHFKSGRFRLEVATGEILDYDSASEGPENDVLATLANEELVKALKQLGADQQECLVLRFLNGLSVAETAHVLAKSEGAVKQLQLRAIRNLAKLLPEGLR